MFRNKMKKTFEFLELSPLSLKSFTKGLSADQCVTVFQMPSQTLEAPAVAFAPFASSW